VEEAFEEIGGPHKALELMTMMTEWVDEEREMDPWVSEWIRQ
jgi:hypothetical protein